LPRPGPLSNIRRLRRGFGSLPALGAALVLGAAVVGFVGAGLAATRRPAGARAVRAIVLRWHELHTPGSGRERVLEPEVLSLVAALERAGGRTFRFTPSLASDVAIAPFLLEASWPIECRLTAEEVVGYAREFPSRRDCVVLNVAGRLALARCHL
jgi:hypothetical protein